MTPMTIDPRIRERRIEVIREAGRRRLRITLVVASTIVVVGLAYLAVRSPLFDVDHIRVNGARRESTADIRAAARVDLGAPLLFVDTGAVARRVERLPWVEHARVHRDLPGTLTITVTDFVPTAFVHAPGGRVALIASTGRVIALGRKIPTAAIEIRGERVVPAVGSLLSPPEAANVVRQLPARLRERVSAIDVDVFALEVRGGGQIRLGSLDHLRAKGVAALAVLDHLGSAPFTYIDVSAPQAPVSR
jgi:cell division protein FtsQ